MIDAWLSPKCLTSRQKVKRWQEGDKCYSRGLTSQGHRAWAFQLKTFQRTKFRPTGAKCLFNETDWALEKSKRGQKPSLEDDKRGVVFTYICCDPIKQAGNWSFIGKDGNEWMLEIRMFFAVYSLCWWSKSRIWERKCWDEGQIPEIESSAFRSTRVYFFPSTRIDFRGLT